MKIIAIVVAGVLAGLFAASATAQTPTSGSRQRALSPEVALRTHAFLARSPVQLSADGEWVAYSVRTSHRYPTFNDFFAPRGVPGESYESQVQVTSTQSGETIEVMPASSNSWTPVWSPDGAYLAFHSDRDGVVNLWIWERSTRRVRKLSSEIARPAWNWDTPSWTPDGRALVVKLLPAGSALEEMTRLSRRTPEDPPKSDAAITARVFRQADASTPVVNTLPSAAPAALPAFIRGAYSGDIAVIDVASGAVRRLTSGVIPSWWSVSPDGRWVAFTHLVRLNPFANQSERALSVVPLAGGPVRDVVDPLAQNWGTAVSWSPRGAQLAFITETPEDTGGVFIVDAERASLRRLGTARAGWSDPHHGPVWSETGGALWFTTPDSLWEMGLVDGRTRAVAGVRDRKIVRVLSRRDLRVWQPRPGSVVLHTRDPDTGMQGFVRADTRSGRIERLAEEHGSFGAWFGSDVSANGDAVVALSSDARRSADLWLLGDDLRRARRLSNSNPAFDGYELASSRLIEWTGERGERLRGALLLPPGHVPGKLVPLIVEAYGGDMGSSAVGQFQPDLQLLATRGYAVLVPDLPVNTGTPMRDIARGVDRAVDRVIALGIADPERLGVIGHSYGGYSVLSVIVQTTRFRAAVASASQGNMFGMFTRMAPDGRPMMTWSERGQGRMGGTPWELRDRYIDNSPLFFLDCVTTPLLLLHGSDDLNTPPHLAEETYTSLRRLGRKVEYVLYEGENHSPGMWRSANRIDYWKRVIAWFDENLKTASASRPRSLTSATARRAGTAAASASNRSGSYRRQRRGSRR